MSYLVRLRRTVTEEVCYLADVGNATAAILKAEAWVNDVNDGPDSGDWESYEYSDPVVIKLEVQ